MQQQLTLENHLKNYFNYPAFRTGQKEIIQDIMQGRDVLGVLPTGSGKSLCYQLPAKLLDGTTRSEERRVGKKSRSQLCEEMCTAITNVVVDIIRIGTVCMGTRYTSY